MSQTLDVMPQLKMAGVKDFFRDELREGRGKRGQPKQTSDKAARLFQLCPARLTLRGIRYKLADLRSGLDGCCSPGIPGH
jgi:hypothetical protein